MIISLNFLEEFLPTIRKQSVDLLEKSLFRSGIEIERLEAIKAPTGVYYGIIRSFEKVEGSNKLNLCQVDIPFKDTTHSIICGGSNVRENLKVVVALPGALLANGKIKIDRREVFGVVSDGMLCAYSELYESEILDKSKDSNDGIIELPEDWDLNRAFNPRDLYLDDWVFDLTIPANRTDLHSAWGLAQELSKNMKIPFNSMPRIYKDNGNPWELKRLLLTNNYKCGDYLKNLNFFIYSSFNETIDPSSGLVVKEKSSYFKQLVNQYLEAVGISQRLEFDPYLPPLVNINLDFLSSFLCIPKEDIESTIKLLTNYSFTFEDGFIIAPIWRTDIKTEKDFSEEIVRFSCMDSIPEIAISTVSKVVQNHQILAIENVKEFFRNEGFFECTTFNLHEEVPGEIKVNNPLSVHHVSLRTNAIKELVEVLERNYKHKNSLHPVFEIVEIQNKGWFLNIVVAETDNSFALNSTKINNDLYDLQSRVKRALTYLNQEVEFSMGVSLDSPFIETNSLLINGGNLGYMGYLNTELPMRVWGALVSLEYAPERKYECPRFSEYPPSFKDFSIEVTEKSPSLGVIISSLKSKYLRDVEILEKYEKDGILSYLIRCSFQSFTGTLNKEEIDLELKTITSILESLNLKVR